MADRRIKDLTTVASPTTSHKLAIDKTGMTEAGAIEISVLLSMISSVKNGSDTLLADTPKTIAYSSAFASTAYILVPYCYDSNGDSVAFRVENRTTTTFDITAAANCSLDYIATA